MKAQKATGGESRIRTAIKNYLQILENQGKLLFQYNNTGAMVSQYKGRTSFMRFGKPGSPDFYLWIPDVHALFLHTFFMEVKDEKGKQNDNQKEFQLKTEKLGGRYIIVRSLDDVIEVLQQHGI